MTEPPVGPLRAASRPEPLCGRSVDAMREVFLAQCLDDFRRGPKLRSCPCVSFLGPDGLDCSADSGDLPNIASENCFHCWCGGGTNAIPTSSAHIAAPEIERSSNRVARILRMEARSRFKVF